MEEDNKHGEISRYAYHDILKGIDNGTTQLSDFQRGWVWDDERIRSLIASITCFYPVSAVMFLEYGGDGICFKSRTFTNVANEGKTPERLVLDGQERLTSVYCAMYGNKPVPTQTIQESGWLADFPMDKDRPLPLYSISLGMRCPSPLADCHDHGTNI